MTSYRIALADREFVGTISW